MLVTVIEARKRHRERHGRWRSDRNRSVCVCCGRWVNGEILMDLSYVPYGLTSNKLDYSKAKEIRQRISDPEMAGLYLMRMGKALLAQVA